MFIAALFAIAKRWKQPKCLLTDGWTYKTWYIRTMENHSALKRTQILTHATTWMSLEGSMLTEISQLQKRNYSVIPHIWGTYGSQIQSQKVEWWLPGTEGKGEWGVRV